MLQLPKNEEKQKSGHRGYISMVNGSFLVQLAFNVDMTFNVQISICNIGVYLVFSHVFKEDVSMYK